MALLSTIKRNAILQPMDLPVTQWNTTNAEALEMTYQFSTIARPDLQPEGQSGYQDFTEEQKNAVRSALAEYASIINVDFVEVEGQLDPDINLSRVNLSISGLGQFEYHYAQSQNGAVNSKTFDGWAFFGVAEDLFSATGRNLLLHEVGHALSLKHPGNYDSAGSPPPGPFLSAAEDNNKYTVMSYNNDPDTNTVSEHLMLYDIAALQWRWGARLATRSGDDVYNSFTANTQAIWDGGGSDTIDASAQPSKVTIDLAQGTFSSIGWADNLAIAYGTVIEKARGGAGHDRIAGNTSANSLSGSNGNDLIDGRSGKDTLFGGNGNDTLRGGSGADRLSGGSGTDMASYDETKGVTKALDGSFAAKGEAALDTLSSIENLGGSNTGADVLAGNAAANVLTGNGGNDTLNGKAGADRLVGGLGRDTLTGGTGTDIFHVSAPTHGGDTITDYTAADSFTFRAAAFNIATGPLDETAFQSAPNTTATTEAVRFLYTTQTHTLWHDANGSGAGGLTKLVTFSGAVTLGSEDFLGV
jgi:serralysin